MIMPKIYIKKKQAENLGYILTEFIKLHEHEEFLHKPDLDCARDVLKKLIK